MRRIDANTPDALGAHGVSIGLPVRISGNVLKRG